MADAAALKIAQTSISHLPELIAVPIAKLQILSGLPADQLLFVLSTLYCIPLGWLARLIPGKFLKDVVGLLCGIFIVYSIIGFGFLHQVFTALVIFIIVEVFIPRGNKKTSEEPVSEKASIDARRATIGVSVFVLSMAYMCGAHIYRLWENYLGYEMDFTAPQMVLTLKLVSYAWSRVDGEVLNEGGSLTSGTSSGEIREGQYRAERAIRSTPSLLTFYAWVFFFPGCFAGPSLDFVEYDRYVSGVAYQKFGLTSAPFDFWAPLQKVGYALLNYPFLALAMMYPVFGWCDSEAFYTEHSVWYRIAYVSFFNGFVRFKYYFAWYLCEAGCVAYGLGLTSYDNKTGKGTWDGMTNSRALLVETASSTQQLTDNWNIRTSEWLKHNVYFRARRPAFLSKVVSERTFANIMTKFTSAFWHGFYPGYYIFFLQLVVVQAFEGPVRKFWVSWLALPGSDPKKPQFNYIQGKIFNVVMYIFVIGSFNWLGSSFVLLQASTSLRILFDSYFFYHIIGAIVCFGILPRITRRGPKPDTATATAAADKDAATGNTTAAAAAPLVSITSLSSQRGNKKPSNKTD